MKLHLDHVQRLNLHALLGARRADIGGIRAIRAIQDRLAPDVESYAAGADRRWLEALLRALFRMLGPRPQRQAAHDGLRASSRRLDHFVAALLLRPFGGPSTSRILMANCSGLNGFWMNSALSSGTPWCTTASPV